MKNIAKLFMLIFILITVPLFAHNPMFKEGNAVNADQHIENKREMISYPGSVQVFFQKINMIQKDLNSMLAGQIRDIKKGSGKKLIMILLISLLYGMIHAAGPGHGKTLVSSYFISQKATITMGIVAGASIAIMHAFSAIGIIGLIYLFIKSSLLVNFEKVNHMVRSISFGLMIIIGLYMLISAVHQRFRSKDADNSGIGKNSQAKGSEGKGLIGIITAAGIVPCPGAAMILLFSINMDIFYAGVLSVIFMSLGMAVTISIVGVATILCRKYSLRILSENRRSRGVFQFSTELFSAFLILFIGTVLLVGNV